ncbi:hypothetical protein ERO13_A08G015000v2 [Gossypium hirsutum]|uniref:FS18A n=5 Tax=Gossypium TaxID=3633 RepID=Q9XER1_GOSHI|nr:FS18A [Gossypium hirsutum]PPS14594.1 hypothetical protein GOBAR_AA05973 [Gossypium barbadense]TYH04624.1 hypothetical protein ES288_A08G021200v1 [Gossypium darwinii]TYI12890.1 hypothetical protein ES332_A08G020200v1 [Gossypium tomentosum]TYJ20795.1 hypothetical protein E1A91_A08G020800v1 [Gossypium mustelinum]
MASSMSLKLACLLVLCMVVGAPLAQGDVTRADGVVTLPRCLPLLIGNGNGADADVDAPACCDIVRGLLSSLLCGGV